MADLLVSDSRVGPAIGLTWLPTVSHQAVHNVLRAFDRRRIQPTGSVGGSTLARSNDANFGI